MYKGTDQCILAHYKGRMRHSVFLQFIRDLKAITSRIICRQLSLSNFFIVLVDLEIMEWISVINVIKTRIFCNCRFLLF